MNMHLDQWHRVTVAKGRDYILGPGRGRGGPWANPELKSQSSEAQLPIMKPEVAPIHTVKN
jgi:hypothetical protein